MNNERDASALKDPIIEEDPKAESSGPDYNNREEDQYICHAGDETEKVIPTIIPIITNNSSKYKPLSYSPYLLLYSWEYK